MAKEVIDMDDDKWKLGVRILILPFAWILGLIGVVIGLGAIAAGGFVLWGAAKVLMQ